MQTGIGRTQMLDLNGLDGLDSGLGNHMDPPAPLPGEGLQSVQEGRCRAAHQVTGLTGDDLTVGQLDGHSGLASGLLQRLGGIHNTADGRGDTGLLHQQLQLIHSLILALTLAPLTQGIIIAADNLLTSGCADSLIIIDAVARLIDTHIGGGLVGTGTGDSLKNSRQDREYLHVTVIVHGSLTVGLQMEGIDHVHVVQICSSRLVGQVDRVLERQVPDREGLELGVAGHDAPLMLMVELGETGGHLSAAGTGRSKHHKGTGGLNIVVAAKSLITDDLGDIMRIALNGIVEVDLHTQALQTLLKGICGRLAGIAGHHNAAHIHIHGTEHVDQAQHVAVIGNTQVATDLILFNITGTDDNDHLCGILHLGKHPDLTVRLKTGQNPGGMIVIKQLPAELQVQLAAKFGNTLSDMLRLEFQVLLVIKTFLYHGRSLLSPWQNIIFLDDIILPM